MTAWEQITAEQIVETTGKSLRHGQVQQLTSTFAAAVQKHQVFDLFSRLNQAPFMVTVTGETNLTQHVGNKRPSEECLYLSWFRKSNF